MMQSLRGRVESARQRLAMAVVAVLLFLMAYHVVFGVNGLISYRQKKQESRELQEQIERLGKENALAEQRIKALKSDPQTIEKEARERLRYARPGEVVYTLPAAKHPAATVTGK